MNEKLDTILEELEKTRSEHEVVSKNISRDYNIRKLIYMKLKGPA